MINNKICTFITYSPSLPSHFPLIIFNTPQPVGSLSEIDSTAYSSNSIYGIDY